MGPGNRRGLQNVGGKGHLSSMQDDGRGGDKKWRVTTSGLWLCSLERAHTAAFQKHNFGGTTFGDGKESEQRERGPYFCAALMGAPFEPALFRRTSQA